MKKRQHDNPRWKRVRAERERLMSDEHESYPVLVEFADAWEWLEQQYEVVNREHEDADEPFAAIMFALDLGFYPPPELMLWMLNAWHTYTAAAGEKTMEEVFLGKPVRGKGNYAARAYDRHAGMFYLFEFMKVLDEGHSQERAADMIIERYNIKVNGRLIEPSSLLRRFRSNPWYKHRMANQRHRNRENRGKP